VQLLDALALGGLAAAVVAGGGDDGGVAGELLGGREVHTGVEQVRHNYVDMSGRSRRSHPVALPCALQADACGGILAPERAVADVLADHRDALVAGLRHDGALGDAGLRGRRG